MSDDDDLLELEEDDGVASESLRHSWRVLIVDDDEDVHASTTMAMSDAVILGRSLSFLHAHSACEGREVLAREVEIAVILLDVVMEESDSGLKLVKVIRDELHLDEVRIILRTGQPGYAPEADAVRDYDINDYKAKSDLTRNKLYASLTSAIRSYQQIHALNSSRRGLAMILDASSRLMAIQGMHDFAAGVITQLAALMQVAPEGLVCAQMQSKQGSADEADTPRVVAAAGHYRPMIDQPLSAVSEARIRDALVSCFAHRHSQFLQGATAIFFGSATGNDMAVFLDIDQPLDDINQRLLEVFCSNISACFDNVRLFQQLNASAYYDMLCAMPNRVALVGAIDQLRAEGLAPGKMVTVVDIDQFSEANHAFGHAYGDRLLKVFAQRLLDRFGGRAIAARLGGDTFALLGKESDVTPHQVALALREPLILDAHEVTVGVTLGLLRLEDTEGDGSSALTDATIALQAAKANGRGQYCYFSLSMVNEIRERVRLLDALRNAVDCERLTVVYQPQFELSTRRTVGVEALLRWRTDTGEYVAPDRFIPLAEHSGLIVGLGEWVLRSACLEACRLAHEGFPLRMAVNLSVVQFRDARFLSMLDAALADTAIDPKMLELEITESMAMKDTDFMTSQVRQLKKRGIAVAIDDFGTGFSSLAYLEQLPVDRLKIDKAFVARLTAENYPNSIAATVTQLARHLGLSVIAEGVETEAQYAWLSEMGVHEGQGWLIGKGMPAAELRAWLKTQPAQLG